LVKQLRDLSPERIEEQQPSAELQVSKVVDGVLVGVNLGRIIYERDPEEDERRRLVWYLSSLSTKLYRLPLRGLDERLDRGGGLAYPEVYVMLETTSAIEVARGRATKLGHYYADERLNQLKPEYDPDYTLPSQAIVRMELQGDTDRHQPRSIEKS